MKITVQELQSIWTGLNAIYQVNEILPGTFDYHMKRNIKVLQSEVKTLQELDESKRDELSDQEIEVPLSQIKPAMLPDKMPNGALELIQPIILDQEQAKHESAIAKILEDDQEE